MRMFKTAGASMASVLALSFATMAASAPAASAVNVVPAVASQAVKFEVFLPLQNAAALDALLANQQNPASSSYHKWLTPAQFSQQFGPSATTVAGVKSALQAQGFSIVAVHSRSIQVAGTVAMVAHAFSTTLSNVQPQVGPARMVASPSLTLPAALKSAGAVIPEFSGLPLLHKHLQVATRSVPDNRNSLVGGYYYTDLKQAYDFPSYTSVVNGKRLDGTGVNVAILISNDVLDTDIADQFNHENFTQTTGKAPPTINRLLVNGGAPFDPNLSDEASLDVQMVLGGAPGANVTLVNIPNLSDENTLAGYLTIVEANTFDIVNSSFGGCDAFYQPAYNEGVDFTGVLEVYDTLFKQGNSQGITFVASSGDSGGLSCPDPHYITGSIVGTSGPGNPATPSRFVAGVEEPASSPHVTAVGGTNLITTTPPSPQTVPATLTSAYVGENAYGDPELAYDPYGEGALVYGGYWGAGGGISSYYPKPSYQNLVNSGSSTFRTTPDIGMHVGGCPGGIAVLPCGPNRSYVIVYLNGTRIGLIGTSIASPEFVGAVALYNEKTGARSGNLNTYLYTAGADQTSGAKGQVYNRAISGFDGKYTNQTPSSGYDYLVGNGTPKVRALFGMSALQAAGVPQSASNP